MPFKPKYLIPYKGLIDYTDDSWKNKDFNPTIYKGLVAYNFVAFTVPAFVITTIAMDGLDSLL